MRPIPVVLIEGDGIGPEISAAALRVVEATAARVEWHRCLAGQQSVRRGGPTVPESTLAAIRELKAALKGPFSTPSGGTEKSANFYIRHRLDLFACLRPLRFVGPDHDVQLVRENIEDLYGAVEWAATPDVAHAVKIATRRGCERIARFALELARQGRPHVTVVHKANNLKLTEGMFLETARQVASEYPDVALDDMLADAAAATLVSAPRTFDVILTSNTFGDLLSSVGGAVAGGFGIVPTLNVGDGVLVAEASHGSADALRDTGRANPLGFVDAGAMLLDRLGMPDEAAAIHAAIRRVRSDGPIPFDLGGAATTSEVTDALCDILRGRRVRPRAVDTHAVTSA
jgi:isocitrate dehydrogenase (NAD+)